MMSVTWCFVYLLESDSDAEIDLEEHRRRLWHVSQVKEATVCITKLIITSS